jgi:hypothetical protein
LNRAGALQAVALASIKGKCVDKSHYHDDGTDVAYGSYTAKALAEAEAKITVKEIYGCKGYVDYSI